MNDQSTQGYLKAIRNSRDLGREVEVDFSALPKDLDHDAIERELSSGLPPEYGQAIAKRRGTGGAISLDFGEIQGAKNSEGFQEGLAAPARVVQDAIPALADLAAKVAPGIVNRLTGENSPSNRLKAGAEAATNADEPQPGNLGPMRHLRAIGAAIGAAIPEVAELHRIEADIYPLRQRINEWSAQVQKENLDLAKQIAPVEDGPVSIPRIAARTALEINANAFKKAYEFTPVTPMETLEMEGMGKAIGLGGRVAMEGIVRAGGGEMVAKTLVRAGSPLGKAAVRVPPEYLKGLYPEVSPIVEKDGLVTLNHAQALDAAVEYTARSKMPSVSEVGSEAAWNAGLSQARKTAWDVLARQMTGLNQPLMRPGEPRNISPEARPTGIGSEGPTAGAPEPRPMPGTPAQTAAETIASGVLDPSMPATAEKFPFVYQAFSGAEVPRLAQPRFEAVASAVRAGLRAPANAPLTPQMLHAAVQNGTVSYADLDDLNRKIHEETMAGAGLAPEATAINYDDHMAAAERPGEALVVHHQLEGHKAELEDIIARKASRIGQDLGKEAAHEAMASEPTPPAEAQTQAAEAPKNDITEVPRAEYVAQAVEKGADPFAAAQEHHDAVVAKAEAGEEVPDWVRADYQEAGVDIPEVPTTEAPMEKHPYAMTPEELATAFPDQPDLHQKLQKQAEEEMQAWQEMDIDQIARENEVMGQPAMDALRKTPISAKAIKALGLEGEFKELRNRGIITNEGGLKVDAAAKHLQEIGILKEQDINEMLDVLESEYRKGTKKKVLGPGEYFAVSESRTSPEEVSPSGSSELGTPSTASGGAVSSSSQNSLPPEASKVKDSEDQIAFNFGPEGLQQYAKKVASDISVTRKSFPNFEVASKAAEQLEKRGYISYVGSQVKNAADAAELFAAFRHPFLEHFQVMIVKDGKVVSHPTITTGIVDLVAIPFEFKLDAKKMILDAEADGYYLLHNHPSGNPTPSREDVKATFEIMSVLPDKFRGHVVVDDTEFSVIDERGGHKRHSLEKPLENFRPDRTDVVANTEKEIETISAEFKDKNKIGVMLTDARGNLLGFESVPPDADILSRVTQAVTHFKASGFVIASDVAHARKIMSISFPKQIIDYVWFKDNTPHSIAGEHGGLGKMKSKATIWEIKQITRVADSGIAYSKMGPEQFGQVLSQRKIDKGSEVTTRVETQGVKKGVRGKILAIDRAGVKMAVQFGDKIVITRPENLKETYAKPPEQVAVESIPGPEKMGKPSEPIKKIVNSQQAGLSQEKISMTQRAALASRLKNQAYGARIAAREVKAKITAEFQRRFKELSTTRDWDEAIAKDKIQNKMQGKIDMLKAKFEAQKAGVEWAKGEIIKYIKDNLPIASRGEFLDAIKNIKSPLDAQDLFFRVDSKAALIYKKALIDDINKMVDRAVDSPSIAIEAKREIKKFMGDLLAGKETPKTMRQVDDYFAKGVGPESEKVKYVWQQIRKMGRGMAKDLPESYFEEAYDRLQSLLSAGYEVQFSRDMARQMDKEIFLQRLVEAKPPKHEYGRQVRGKDLQKPSLFDRAVVNKWLKVSDWWQKNYHAILPADAMLDDMGGNPGTYSNPLVGAKKEMDGHIWDLMDEEDGIVKEYDKLAKNLPAESFKKIGIVLARNQAGGTERLLSRTDLTENFIKTLQLTPQEEAARAYIRKVMDDLHPKIEKVMAETENRPVRKVLNYFSWMTDWEALNDLRIEERFQFDPSQPLDVKTRQRSPEKGFTKGRGAKESPVEIDANKVFRAYVHNSLYLAHMYPSIKKFSDIFNSREFGDIVGGETQSALKDFMEVIARDGRADGAKRRVWLDRLRTRVGAGLVPFHITPALLHASKWFNAPILFGSKAALAAGSEFSTNPDVREFLRVNVPEWRERSGYDDPTLQELEFSKWLGKVNKTGLIPLRYAEQWSSGCTLWAAYKDVLRKKGAVPDLQNPDREALLDAAMLMRRAEGSPMPKDIPLALSAGRGMLNNVSDNRAVAQFHAFPWNRFSYMVHDIPVKFKQDKLEGAFASAYMAGAYAAEIGARATGHWLQIGLLGLLGFETKDMIKKQEKRDKEFAGQFIEEIIRTVPIAGQVYDTAKYDKLAVAALSEPVDLAHGVYSLATAKTDRGAMSGFWKALNATGALLGVGVVTQAATMFSKILTGEAKPHYQVRMDNLKKVDSSRLVESEKQELREGEKMSAEFEAKRKDLNAAYEAEDMVGMEKAMTAMQANLQAYEDSLG